MSGQATATSAGAARSAGAVARAGFRRSRIWLLVIVIILGAALAVALGSASRGNGGWLDPRNAAPDGGRALAYILSDQGVRVVAITRSADLAEQSADGATVVVAGTDALGRDQLARLARTTGPLVLVEPDDTVLARLAPGVQAAGLTGSDVTEPRCADPGAQAAGAALAGGVVYRAAAQLPGSPGVTVCYPSGDQSGAGSYVLTQANGRPVTVIGQGDLLSNGALGAQGNAALALATLGRTNQLVWYLPDPLEAGSGDGSASITRLLPDWVGWAVLQLGVVIVLAMLWRGRRLGALVFEPLPVVVQAAETQLGRARLYRQARARGRAADTLRAAALQRLAHRLAAPATSGPHDLVQLVAQGIGRPEQQVGQVLLGPPPASDAELIRLASQLDELEELAAADERRASRAGATAGERRS